VRLFIDEDTGGGIARALRELRVPVSFIGTKGIRGMPKGTADEIWIPFVGERGWLVFSSNVGILDAEAQRALWVKHNVGGVFLTTGQGNRLDIMALILKKLTWFEEIDATIARPFAFLLPITGRPRRDPRVLSRGEAAPIDPGSPAPSL
jgi:hypothetical protein